MTHVYRIGADENGLGARLGPLIVTAVLARVDPNGERVMKRRLPKRLRKDLDDSKRLVSHSDFGLGEAWARALVGPALSSPDELLTRLCLEPRDALREPCPGEIAHQCWSVDREAFAAEPKVVARMQKHLAELATRGIEIVAIRTSITCTKRLNQARQRGHNRFVSDLHAMERLVLELRRIAGQDVFAICGKVGGIGEYSKFFGPLAGWLHAIVEERRARSGYRFPGLGEVHFVQDADATDPLVMLASLVGKYVRELTMARVARYYTEDDIDAPENRPSGYHDPVTARFVEATALVRKKRRVPIDCFERARDEADPNVETRARSRPARAPASDA